MYDNDTLFDLDHRDESYMDTHVGGYRRWVAKRLQCGQLQEIAEYGDTDPVWYNLPHELTREAWKG